MDKNTLIKVSNRGRTKVVYTIPDLGIRRIYQPNETKEVTFEELEKLSYTHGGRIILADVLIVRNEEAVEKLIGPVEPEYYYTMDEVKDLLINGSYDQLDDCLTFGGSGIADLVKKASVDIELNDMRKRKLIFDKTGYNVNNAISIKQTNEIEEDVTTENTGRKAAVFEPEKNEVPERKAQKYKVTSYIDK